MENELNNLNWRAIKPVASRGFWYCGSKDRESDIVLYYDNKKHAKLIAAAPDLLAAALQIKNEIDTDGLLQGSYEKLLEAIEKATK